MKIYAIHRHWTIGDLRLFWAVVWLLQVTVTVASDTAVTPMISRPETVVEIPKVEKVERKQWFENLSIRGYMQVRYNGLYQTNRDLECPQCDRSWGGDNAFFIRRMRIIFFGQIHPRVFLYLQPDFASSVTNDQWHYTQLRDAYFDVGLDSKNEYRLRVGQSKVPYGFENMQSSQNRLPLDRNDALNSAVLNERDLGVFFYWAPERKRKLLARVVSENYKGSGDYGIFALGAYNGQTANRPDLNHGEHWVSRFTWPFEIGRQIFEPSIQAYSGKWVMPSGLISKGVETLDGNAYRDQRVAATINWYPKPFGFLAEYTYGIGPEYDKATNSIQEKLLKGGFITLNYRHVIKEDHVIFPFIRMQHYNGGKKFEVDARRYEVNEYEFGVEWQPFFHFEVVAMHTYAIRRFEDSSRPYHKQQGHLMRIQLQVNF